MNIYLDADYKCHITNDGIMQPYETDAFDGKCAAYIEGYRLVPEGETWVREDGEVFAGLMVAPWKPLSELEAAQAAYEQARAELLVPAEAAYMEGVNSI